MEPTYVSYAALNETNDSVLCVYCYCRWFDSARTDIVRADYSGDMFSTQL